MAGKDKSNVKLHGAWALIALIAGGVAYYVSYKVNSFKFYEMGWRAADAERALSDKEVAKIKAAQNHK